MWNAATAGMSVGLNTTPVDIGPVRSARAGSERNGCREFHRSCCPANMLTSSSRGPGVGLFVVDGNPDPIADQRQRDQAEEGISRVVL